MSITTTGGTQPMSASVLDQDVAEVLIDATTLRAKVVELGALV